MIRDNADQFSMIVGGEQATVEKRAEMLHQSSVILDARDDQRVLHNFESRDLLEIQYMGQRLIRHVDIRDHRRQVCLPVDVPSVYYEKFYGRHLASNTTVQVKAFVDNSEQARLIASCHDRIAWSSRKFTLVPWMPVETPQSVIFLHINMLKNRLSRHRRSVKLLIRDTCRRPGPVS